MKIPKNTDTFEYYNANPKNKRTSDCVVRALCTAMGQSYEQTLFELTEFALSTGYFVNDVKCYGKYLESKGWIKNKQPHKPDNTKYTGKEFVKNISNTCIAHIGTHHIVCIMDGKIKDIWDSSNGKIGNYWTK